MKACVNPTPGRGGADPLRTGQQIQFSGLLMAALIAIGVFIAAIFLLNLVEFGRLD